ncbi:unnamed protein product, partial [marine sediment metagenome]
RIRPCTKDVLISVTNQHATEAYAVGLRKKGSALIRSIGSVLPIASNVISYPDSTTMIVAEVDANRELETYSASILVKFGVKGYWL